MRERTAHLSVSCVAVAEEPFVVFRHGIRSHVKWFVEKFEISYLVTNYNIAIGDVHERFPPGSRGRMLRDRRPGQHKRI